MRLPNIYNFIIYKTELTKYLLNITINVNDIEYSTKYTQLQ